MKIADWHSPDTSVASVVFPKASLALSEKNIWTQNAPWKSDFELKHNKTTSILIIWGYIVISICIDYFKASVDMPAQGMVRHWDVTVDLFMQRGSFCPSFMMLTNSKKTR